MDYAHTPLPQPPDFQIEGLWEALARLDRMLEEAAMALEAAASSSSPDPYRGPYDDAGFANTAPAGARFAWLQRVFGLEPLDLDIILVTLAVEVDLRYERQFGYLQGDAAHRAPTVDLVLNLLCASREAKFAARQRFAPDAPLLWHRLLRQPGSEGSPLLAQPLRLEPSVAHFLLGKAELDARLRPFARIDTPAADAPCSRAAALARIMSQECEARGGAHFHLEGPSGGDQAAAVACLAVLLRARTLTVTLAKGAEPDGGFANAMQLLLLEARLHGALLYLVGLDSLPERQQVALAELLEARAQGASKGIVIMAGARPCGPRFATTITIRVAPPSFSERRAMWAAALREHRIDLAARGIDELASRYRLSEAQIKRAVASVERHAALQQTPRTTAEFASAARLQCACDPGSLARKLAPFHGWDDLILPDSQMGMLKALCGQARYRHVVYDEWGFDRKLSLGKGLSALFTGPPGTGKTMAVEVIANDLGLELFKIDLSQIVSKYIGETEKGLDRLFAEARAGNAILFFDECDALFGKRTMVQDAHDRYANIEVAYLLQKLEEHEGLSILATNLRPNMDVAFTRRLSFIVEFPFPDEPSRRRLWQSIWPAQVPRSKDLDLEFMATQFKLSGGAVKNIALAAAFIAARNGGELRTEHLLWATRGEIEKSGQRVAASAFGRYGRDVDALAAEGTP